MMIHPARRDDIRRGRETFLDCRKGVWGTDKLRIETNIRRTIARPDACGDLNRRGACSCSFYDNATIGLTIGAVTRTLSDGEACA